MPPRARRCARSARRNASHDVAPRNPAPPGPASTRESARARPRRSSRRRILEGFGRLQTTAGEGEPVPDARAGLQLGLTLQLGAVVELLHAHLARWCRLDAKLAE